MITPADVITRATRARAVGTAWQPLRVRAARGEVNPLRNTLARDTVVTDPEEEFS